MESKKHIQYDAMHLGPGSLAINNLSSEKPSGKNRLTRRSFVMGGLATAGVAIAYFGAFRGSSIDKAPAPVDVDQDLVADAFIRQEPAASVDMDALNSLYQDIEPDPEPKKEPKAEPKEKPQPKTKGLEIFAEKSLPEGIVDRIKREGLPGKIEAQRHVYDHAAKETGVPWQLMAAINYREASLRPELSMLDGSSLSAGTSQDGVPIYNNAKKDAVTAAGILKSNAKRHYDVNITKIDKLSETDIANALLAYNRGSMYLNNPDGPMSVAKSPYVYNYMDGKQMKWKRADSYDGSKRLNRMYENGQKDNNLGALVIVSYLMQNS